MGKMHAYFTFDVQPNEGTLKTDLVLNVQIKDSPEFIKPSYNDLISHRITTSLINRVNDNANFFVELWVCPRNENAIYTVFPLEINIIEYFAVLRRGEQNTIHIRVKDTPAGGGALRKIIIDSDHPF